MAKKTGQTTVKSYYLTKEFKLTDTEDLIGAKSVTNPDEALLYEKLSQAASMAEVFFCCLRLPLKPVEHGGGWVLMLHRDKEA
jgi:hypothetical protein